MQTKIEKWDDGLAIRIPTTIAERHGIAPESTVEISSMNEKLVITPVAQPNPPILETLLSRVTAANLHDEIDTGPPVGGEAW